MKIEECRVCYLIMSLTLIQNHQKVDEIKTPNFRIGPEHQLLCLKKFKTSHLGTDHIFQSLYWPWSQ